MATKVADAPAKGQAQQAAQTDSEKVISNSRQVTSDSVVVGGAPGSINRKDTSVVLEGLGDLSEVSLELHDDEDVNSGEGEFVTVLHNYVAGLGTSYPRGSVRRISKFLHNYGTKDPKQLQQVRLDAKRLFDLEAIRLSTNEEKGQGFVELTDESPAVVAERNKRIALEQQLENIKRQQQEQPIANAAGGPSQDPAQNWN